MSDHIPARVLLVLEKDPVIHLYGNYITYG